MIGLKFRNVHSSSFGVCVKSTDRSLIPELRKNEFVIPGRHGSIDYGSSTYETRKISVKISAVNNTTWEEYRANARELAQWLSGKGLLIFDDEPDRAYQASVYESVGIEQLECLPVGVLNVVFECQPFAESLDYAEVNTPDITASPNEISLTVEGTAETGCIITIKNTGDTDVTGISIRRKVAI